MTRKELLRSWSQGRISSFLSAERKGRIKEVEGGWLIDGRFCEKMPFKGPVLDSYLEYLAEVTKWQRSSLTRAIWK